MKNIMKAKNINEMKNIMMACHVISIILYSILCNMNTHIILIKYTKLQ